MKLDDSKHRYVFFSFMSFLPRDNRMVFTNDKLNKKYIQKNLFLVVNKCGSLQCCLMQVNTLVLSLERLLHFNRRKVKNFALSLKKKSAVTDRKTK